MHECVLEYRPTTPSAGFPVDFDCMTRTTPQSLRIGEIIVEVPPLSTHHSPRTRKNAALIG